LTRDGRGEPVDCEPEKVAASDWFALDPPPQSSPGRRGKRSKL